MSTCGVAEIPLDAASADRIARLFAADQKQIEAAMRRAVNKLGRWVRSTALTEGARDSGVQRKVLADRVRLTLGKNKRGVQVWFGLWPVPLRLLKPKQTATGVSAGPVDRRHAFIVTGRDGKRDVFRRSGDSAYPIFKQYHSVDDEIRRVLEVDVFPRLDAQFSKFFEQELRWEVSKAR
ncbi:hypothetical protein JCM16814_34850 [Desulfobaculum senezii]